MKKILVIFISAIVVLSSCTQKPNLNVKLKDENDTVSYLIGLYFAKQTKQSEPEKLNPEAIAKAFNDVFYGDTVYFTEEQISMKLQSYFTKLQVKKSKENKEAGEKFLAENKKKTGVITTPSGLQYEVVKEGTGPMPDSSDVVSVNYVGTTIDKKEFDASAKHGGPAKFVVTQVVPGWTEALLKMKVGSKWKLYIPSDIAYGENGNRGIQPNSTLIFEVELLGIEPKTEAPAGQPSAMRPGMKMQ